MIRKHERNFNEFLLSVRTITFESWLNLPDKSAIDYIQYGRVQHDPTWSWNGRRVLSRPTVGPARDLVHGEPGLHYLLSRDRAGLRPDSNPHPTHASPVPVRVFPFIVLSYSTYTLCRIFVQLNIRILMYTLYVRFMCKHELCMHQTLY